MDPCSSQDRFIRQSVRVHLISLPSSSTSRRCKLIRDFPLPGLLTRSLTS